MQDYIYSVIASLAMVIHLIINFDLRTDRGQITAHGSREYRSFLKGVFAYYIVDAGWGVFAGLGWTKVLYVDTMLYYIAIAVTVLMWCRFVATYLELGKWRARTLFWFGYALLALYVVLLTANVFNSWLFHFDSAGNYVSGFSRRLMFYPLVALNVLMAIFVFVKACGSHGHVRNRNMVVFLFCLTMAVAIVLQIVWPLWPYYALGCLIGNCFFHVFVIEDERTELRKAVFGHEQAVKHAAELEQALARARKAEKAKSVFFSIVSHDIRTPLNAILGYSELLQHGIEDKAERDNALESIRTSGTTLLQLVNDVLDLAKMDSGEMVLQPEGVNLSQLTDEVFSSFWMAAKDKGIELVNKTEGVPAVMLDGHRFRQVLFNLIGNAVKFTERGSVTVSASYSGSNLEFSVSDTGCGIASELLPRIFDPFVQAQDPSHSAYKAGGTGLGLSICRRIVEAMGGELVVESELGSGSAFRGCIPGVAAAGDGAKPSVESAPAMVPEKLPKRVLVIDDSPVNREVLASLLEYAGIASVDQASDGEEAFMELNMAMEAHNPYDFIFSALWMPNMNGIEFIEKLRADSCFSRLPVFAVTADAEFRRDARNKLFTGILLKPLTYAKILEAFAVTRQ